MSVSLFTLSDVAHHNSHKDGWIVVDGDVLDVTEYMSSHPGGAEEIHPYLGKDATSAFAAIEHSKYALKLLQKFKIGMIGVPVEESSEMKQLPLQHDPVRKLGSFISQLLTRIPQFLKGRFMGETRSHWTHCTLRWLGLD